MSGRDRQNARSSLGHCGNLDNIMTNVVAKTRFCRLRETPMLRVGSPKGYFAGTLDSIKSIFMQRQLIALVIRRELRTKYKGSFTGILWSLARPLAMIVIYYFFVGQILGAARSIPDFAVYMFTGFATWALFSESMASATLSLVGNAGLVRKVSLPREIFPISTTSVAVVNFLTQVGLLIVFIVIIGSPVNFANIGIAIMGIAMLVTFSLALGLLVSAATVFFRDLQHLVDVALMFLFWGSPVLYSVVLVKNLVTVDWVVQIYLANPVTTAILSMQSAFWGAGELGVGNIGLRVTITWVISLVLLWFAQRVFNRLQGSFAQEL